MKRELDERCTVENCIGMERKLDPIDNELGDIVHMDFSPSGNHTHPFRLTVKSDALSIPMDYSRRQLDMISLCFLAYPDFFEVKQ